MFSDRDILNAVENGSIKISNFNRDQLNINSYDVRLGNWFYLLIPDVFCKPRYFGPLWVGDGHRILVPSGMTLLGMTKEFLASYGNILGQLRSKSSTRRSGITVCDDAGFGDVGYANNWTVELTAHVSGPGVYLTVGERFAQILFQRTETQPIAPYSGQYNVQDWPRCMLPKKYRDDAISWGMLASYSPQVALMPWTLV